jgi:peptidoglycan/xylan/chitin deacetylase (PgdA/CDA1 family)
MASRRLIAMATLTGAAFLALAGCSSSHPTSPAQASWHQGRAVTATGQGASAGLPGQSPAAPGPAKNGPAPKSSPSASTPAGPPAPPASSAPPQKQGLGLAQLTTGTSSVALTFDDGPSTYTPQLLKILRDQGVKATFCLIGVNVQKYPDYVKQIVADGHTLCNHSWNHDEHLGEKSADVIRTDMQKTNDAIHAAVPDAPIKYFRHPAGNFTTTAVQIAQSLGMASLGWDVDPDDWDNHKYSKGQKMADHICATLRKHIKPGSIVLSHDSGGDRTGTMDAYTTLLPELKSQYTLIAMPV